MRGARRASGMRLYADRVRAADLALIVRIRADLVAGDARRARAAAGVRQAEFASAIGVSRQAVSQWESGRRVPSARHALAYGRLLQRLASAA